MTRVRIGSSTPSRSASSTLACRKRTSVASHGGPYAHLLDEAKIAWTRLEPMMTEANHRAFLDALLSIGVDDKPFYEDAFMRAAVRAEANYLREVGAQLGVIGFNLTTYLSTRLAGIPLAASHGGSFLPPVLERGLCPLPVNPTKPEMTRLPKFVQRWLVHNVPYLLSGPTRHLNRIAGELGTEKLPSFKVAAAVIMGGQGSVQTAMASGTPFVGMPYHGEQELNVALAERKGMAIRVSPKQAGDLAMTVAVRRLLEEPSFRENAARMRELYAHADGAAGAADAIQSFVRARRAKPSDERQVAS